MKKHFTKYYFAILTFTALAFLFGGLKTRAQFVAQTDAPQDLRGASAIEYLKQTNSYDSLREAIKDSKSAENPSASDLAFVARQKLIAPNGAASDAMGWSVALSGDTAVVGAPTYSSGSNAGAVYVFVRSGAFWTQQAKLTPSDGQIGDYFGKSVSISGDSIIVGAPGDNIGSNNDQGSAYIFIRNGTTWSAQDKLVETVGEASDEFGTSVSISGDTAVVGIPWDDIGQNNGQGSALVYVRSGGAWTIQQKLTAATGTEFDNFGTSLSLASGTVIIGAPVENSSQGAAYIFSRSGNTWSQQGRLVASDGSANDFFGQSVDLSLTVGGVFAVVGAPRDNVAGNTRQGSAYVFSRSQIGTWSQTQKFIASDGGSEKFFGISVAITPISGGMIAIGEPYGSFQRGNIHIYRRVNSVWSEEQTIQGQRGDFSFGWSVAASTDTVIGGMPFGDNGSNSSQGAAYIFNLGGANPFDFDGDGKADVSVFRPSNGSWWYYRSSDAQTTAASFGTSTDKIAPGDYTGDGKADIAIFRPSNGNWFVMRSEDNSFFSFPFGTNGDVPAPADFDGDGKTDPAVFRPSNGTWYINQSSGGTGIVQFGAAGDVPVAADYDGDGKADIAIFRPSDGSWWYLRSTDLQFRVFRFGVSTDKPVQGDWTGDGKADIAVFRPATGEWFVQRSEDNSFYSVPFGTSGDVPAPGDYDGDGRFDTAVFRPSTATWYINRSTAGVAIQQFGLASDKPVPSAFVP